MTHRRRARAGAGTTGLGPSTLGARIRSLRLERGLTQRQVADPAYTASYISTVETGRTRPSAAALRHIADRLGLTQEELVTGRPPGLATDVRSRLTEAQRILATKGAQQAVAGYRELLDESTRHGLDAERATALVGLGHCALDTGDLDDALLTTALRDGGDAGAAEELYRRHADGVLAYARTCCRDPHTAEDLASEAFTRTVRDGKGPTDAWRPYLLAVVRHTAAQWAERDRRVDLAPEFDAWLEATARDRAPAPAGEEQSGEDRVLRAVDGGLIAAAFRSLPERWRAVLWHSVVEDEPATRVGTLLELTPSGVASLTARAREGLREAYLTAHAEQGAVHEECRRCSGRLAAAVRRSRRRRDVHLDRHLDQCGRCRRAVRELTDLNQRLRSVLPAAVLLFGGPAYLKARATAASAVGPATGVGVTGAKAGVLAAGAAAVLFGGWALWPGGGAEPEAPLPAVSTAPSSFAAPSPPPASQTSRSPRQPSATASPSPSVSAPSAPATSTSPRLPALGGPSTLRFVSTGRCMEIPGGAVRPGVRPVEAACDGGAAQQWSLLEPFPGDRARTQVRNEATGMCLTRSGSTEDHAPVTQQTCDAGQANQLWNLWTDTANGEAALRTADGTRYLGLVEWPRADKDQEHGTAIGTTRYYYGSASMRFRYEPRLLEKQRRSKVAGRSADLGLLPLGSTSAPLPKDQEP